ncbi:UNVERIFIED_CONTAM: hypothetical protein Slati_1353700 [Sesamum latifolium]|uniref:Uncharacterized protein n=1 Tax=Sesamum latifolium TaxID=2727402 RepID=A0AAW2XIZ1_9LAMI
MRAGQWGDGAGNGDGLERGDENRCGEGKGKQRQPRWGKGSGGSYWKGYF